MINNILSGHIVELKTSNPIHMGGSPVAENKGQGSSFSEMLSGAINKVNDLQVDSDQLTQKMVYAPETVDIHEVMIAGQKAEISLSFVKTVRDEALRAYKEILNMR